MEKKLKISKQKYVNIEISLPEKLLFDLMMEAHKQDITLNELCNRILSEYVKKVKANG